MVVDVVVGTTVPGAGAIVVVGAGAIGAGAADAVLFTGAAFDAAGFAAGLPRNAK